MPFKTSGMERSEYLALSFPAARKFCGYCCSSICDILVCLSINQPNPLRSPSYPWLSLLQTKSTLSCMLCAFKNSWGSVSKLSYKKKCILFGVLAPLRNGKDICQVESLGQTTFVPGQLRGNNQIAGISPLLQQGFRLQEPTCPYRLPFLHRRDYRLLL